MERQLVTVRLGPEGARPKGHPTLGLEHPGRRVVQANGRERPGRKAETQRWPTALEYPGEILCPPGLEHPGQAARTGTWARGTRAPGRRPGSAGDGVRAKEAAGVNATVDAGARTVGRMEAREMAREQGCRGRSRGCEGDRQSRDRPEDQRRKLPLPWRRDHLRFVTSETLAILAWGTTPLLDE